MDQIDLDGIIILPLSYRRNSIKIPQKHETSVMLIYPFETDE